MSKVIIRKSIRILETASVQVMQSNVSPSTGINLQQSPALVDQMLSSCGSADARNVAVCSINATADAGFQNVSLNIASGIVHIYGDNGSGERIVAEVKVSQKGEVETIRTDTLNVQNCDIAEERFNESLKRQGITFHVAETVYSGNSCQKPPIPLSSKLKRNKKNLLLRNKRKH